MERPEPTPNSAAASAPPGEIGMRPQTPIAAALHDRLCHEFAPTRLEIINDSEQHAHHVAMKQAHAGKTHPKGRETHFRVVMESEKLRGLSRLACHQLVYKILQPEIALGIHALSLELRAPHDPA
ncbi:MAG: BolA family protein [Candidatus Symbiobacter sp.]|nr:BolA family protein [Candidatus Symbiobacter sp.]